MPVKHKEIEIIENDPFQHCKLGREKYAKVLTDIIDGFPEGFVLAINNEWGTGKTTFVKMWRQMLINDGFNTLYFNAWENDFESDTLTAILAEIKKVLPEKKKDSFNSVLARGALLSKKIVPAFAKQFTKKHFGDELADIVEKATEGTAEIMNDEIDGYLKRQKGIEEFRIALANSLKNGDNPKPLIFIIDELDRCRPNYAVEFLEKVKHFFNVTGIVFVLSIDKIQLGNAIKGVYGSEKLDSDEYLRRFIDVEYSIPNPKPLDFCTYLYDYFDFNDFIHNQFRINTPDFHEERESLIHFAATLFYQNNFTLRQQEKFFAHARLALKCFRHNNYLFPSVFLILIFISSYHGDVYLKIKSTQYNLQEFVNEIEKLLPKENAIDFNRILIRTEALLLLFYSNSYRQINHTVRLVLHTDALEDANLIRTKYDSLVIHNMITKFLSENFSGMDLTYLTDKVDLAEGFKA